MSLSGTEPVVCGLLQPQLVQYCRLQSVDAGSCVHRQGDGILVDVLKKPGGATASVYFVENQQRAVFGFNIRGWRILGVIINHQQGDVGVTDSGFCPTDTLSLDGVVTGAQACGVDNLEGHTPDDDVLFQQVPGSPWYAGDNRHIISR